MCLCCKVQCYVVESCSDGQTSIADKEDKVNDLVSKKTADLFDTCYEIDRVLSRTKKKEKGATTNKIVMLKHHRFKEKMFQTLRSQIKNRLIHYNYKADRI